jgi:hypothetical protein
MTASGVTNAPLPDPPLRAMVRLAHFLVEVDSLKHPENAPLLWASSRLRPGLALDLPALHALLSAGLEKFKVFAPVLEVDVAKSRCVQRIEGWLRDTSETLVAQGVPAADAAA